jgi:periplasmic protein TonB
MQFNHRQNALLPGFITVSLLLHLLLIYLVPELALFPPPAKEPVVVELRPSEPTRLRDRELDLPPDTPPHAARATGQAPRPRRSAGSA